MHRPAIQPLDTLIRRLARRAMVPHLVLGVLLLILVAGVIFLAFACIIAVRSRQLLRALHDDPARVTSLRLQSRHVSPAGVGTVTGRFAVIGFVGDDGKPKRLHLKGPAAELAELRRLLRAANPVLDDQGSEEVRVTVMPTP